MKIRPPRAPGPPTSAPAAILRQALAWKDAAADVALATIVRAWPTAPMRAGSQMAVRGDGVRCGSLFGPPVDARVAQAALDVLDRGADPKLGVAVDDATASTAGLACGGALEIRLEAITEGDAGHAGLLRAALHAIEDRQGVVLCTRLSDGLRACLPANGAAAHAWAAEARDRARADDTRYRERGRRRGAVPGLQCPAAALRGRGPCARPGRCSMRRSWSDSA